MSVYTAAIKEKEKYQQTKREEERERERDRERKEERQMGVGGREWEGGRKREGVREGVREGKKEGKKEEMEKRDRKIPDDYIAIVSHLEYSFVNIATDSRFRFESIYHLIRRDKYTYISTHIHIQTKFERNSVSLEKRHSRCRSAPPQGLDSRYRSTNEESYHLPSSFCRLALERGKGRMAGQAGRIAFESHARGAPIGRSLRLASVNSRIIGDMVVDYFSVCAHYYHRRCIIVLSL